MRRMAHLLGSTQVLLQNHVSVGIGLMHKSRYSVAILLVIATVMSPPLTLLAKSPVASASLSQNDTTIVSRSEAESYYINALNTLRAERGLAPMVIDTRLSESAHNKGIAMVQERYWDHYSPSGKAFSDYIWQLSPRAQHIGENLARCYESRPEAFNALIASPTHYAIMVGAFTNFGVAEVYDTASGCTYTTMHFASYNR